MPRANEIKKGMVLNYNGKLLLVKDIDIQSPTARGAATLYKMRFSDVRTGLKVEERFKGDDIVDTVTLTRRYVDFSYVDGNEYVFMDKEDYTPYTFTKDQIEEELLFMPEGGMPDMQVLTWDGQLLALELPQTVDREIVETAPGIKGASASARGAATLYKMRFADVRTGLKVEERFKGDDIVDTVTLTRRYVDFSYVDGNEYVFMDKEDYTPYIFTKDQIEEELLFIPEGGMPDMQVLTWDGVLLALELPQTVDLEIVETAPGIKGASASARNKPATLTTGLVVQVPEYLSAGEKIRIHIEEKRYMGRAD